jgi:hypothetical protein
MMKRLWMLEVNTRVWEVNETEDENCKNTEPKKYDDDEYRLVKLNKG